MLVIPTNPRIAFGLAATALALVLAGCSGRDTDMAEKLARAEAAAQRAEDAAAKAEAAARRVPAARPPEPSSEPEADKTEPAFGEPSAETEPAA